MDKTGFKIFHKVIRIDLIRECREILPFILSEQKYIDSGMTFSELYKNKPDRFPNTSPDEFDERELFIVSNPCKDYVEFKRLLASDELWEIVALCFAKPIDDISFSFLNITRKPAKYGPSINWHRDFANKMTSTKSSENMLRVIIPLDSSGASNGGISVVADSNKVSDATILAGKKINVEYCSKNNKAISLNTGDVLVISSKLIHGGSTNRNNTDRNHVVIQFVLKGSEYLYENKDEPYYNYGFTEIRDC